MLRVRSAAAFALLALQVVGMVHARFAGTSYFSWGPHDCQTRYVLEAWCAGSPLTDQQIAARYGLPARGWNAHAPADVVDTVERCERASAGDDHRVRLTLDINGHRHETWEWPR